MNRRTTAFVLVSMVSLSGCVAEPALVESLPPSVPDTNVYFYPATGHAQSEAQQGRDRYECNEWAVQQTDFDPSRPEVPPHQRMQIVAGGPPPGVAVGTGAATGAVLGAVVSSPRDVGRGTLIGALAGAAIGGIEESERANQANALQAEANARERREQNAAVEQKASRYRRALGACLEARGYAVK